MLGIRPDLRKKRTIRSLAILVEQAELAGLSGDDLLDASGIPVDALEDPDYEIEAWQECRFIQHLCERELPDGFALETGNRYRASALGVIGYTLLACDSLGQAIEKGVELFNHTSGFSSLYFETTGDEAWLLMDLSGYPGEIRPFIAARDAAAAAVIYEDLVRTPPPINRVWFSTPPIASLAHYKERLHCEPDFEKPMFMIAFPREVLDTPLPMANKLTRKKCEKVTSHLLEQRRIEVGLSGELAQYLRRNIKDMPTLETAAGDFHITPRTLRRRLADEGTTYRQLVEDTRSHLARDLLLNSAMTIQEIASHLSYQDATSFITAFKRWTGRTPDAFRRAENKETTTPIRESARRASSS